MSDRASVLIPTNYRVVGCNGRFDVERVGHQCDCYRCAISGDYIWCDTLDTFELAVSTAYELAGWKSGTY